MPPTTLLEEKTNGTEAETEPETAGTEAESEAEADGKPMTGTLTFMLKTGLTGLL